jgi:RNA polymerase sigma factor (sigma-70 family)
LLKKRNGSESLEERTKALGHLVRSGDAEAQKELIELHMPLARHVAHKFHAHANDRDDTLQNAYLGLCRAVEKYDPDIESTFSTYAYWWIKNQIMCGIKRREIVRVSQNVRVKANNARRFIQKYVQKFHQEPTDAEVAEALGVEVARMPAILLAMMTMANSAHTEYVDTVQTDTGHLSDNAENLNHHEERAFARVMLNDPGILQVLSETERDIVKNRFDLSGQRNKYRHSKSNVDMAIKNALRKMKLYLIRKNIALSEQRKT